MARTISQRLFQAWVAAALAAASACSQQPATGSSAAAGEQRGFLVVVDAAAAAEISPSDATAHKRRGAALVAAAQARVLANVAGVEVVRRYAHLPVLHVRARDEAAARALVGQAGVVRVEAEVGYAHQSIDGLAQVQEAAAEKAGQLGAGTTIAIVDGPVDATSASFGRCAEAGSIGSPGCKLAASVRFAPGDGSALPRAHATNVAAIALGVAPGARIAALDVFSGPTAYAGEILAAIDWAIEHQGEFGLAALNLSLGAGEHTVPCADDAMSVAIAWARVAGIIVTVAAGNDGHTGALASPACAPAAVSVGAVYAGDFGRASFGGCADEASAADRVTCFSNSAPFLTLLAPGAMITAGGSTMAGTSQAAPFVAGAAAVLRAAFPAETSSELVQRLRRSSTTVVDARNQLSLPRLDLAAALSLPAAHAALGSVGFAEGEVAPGASVTLQLEAAADVAEVCLSNGLFCVSGFQPISDSMPWRLLDGSGPRTVRAWFRTRSGDISAVPASATILVDDAAPLDGQLSADAAAGAAQLHWSGFTDATSGITGYRLVAQAGAAPASCAAGTVLYEGPGVTYVEQGLDRGSPRGYRLCARDRGGLWSSGAVASATPL